MTDRNKVLEMISKMSRLTEDAGAFRGEASAAAAKIQELMEKYAISQVDIQNYLADTQEKEFKAAFEQVQSEFSHKNVQEWEWSLARLIADITMTRCFSRGIGNHRWSDGKYGAHFIFFGVKENAEAAAELYTLWHENILKMAEKARWANVLELKKKYGHYPKFRHWIKENRPEEDPQYFKSSWIRGCLDAMHMKVYEEQKAREEAREKAQESQASNANALVVYRAELDKAYDEYREIAKFKRVKRGGSKGFSSNGYQKGQETGKKVKIGSKQLE